MKIFNFISLMSSSNKFISSSIDFSSIQSAILGRRSIQNSYVCFEGVLILSLLTLTCLIAHFADHPIEDLIEKIACQFTAQHTKGRPRPPFWYPGFPLYVCDSQYNDCERVFVKITNWNGCIPEEVRQESGEEGGEFMPIYPFEKIIWPKKVGSPFLVGRGSAVKGVKGPGGIVNVPVGNGVDGGGDGDNSRKKLRSDGNPGRAQQQQQQQSPATTTVTGMATLQTAHAVQSQNPYQHFQQPYVQQQQQIVSQPQTQRSTTLGPDRSIITAAGGIAAIGGPSQVEKLPADTGKSCSNLDLCSLSLLSS